ncbi:type VII secretion target [Microbacterium gorillae]|uniref:type VII secretion target n=1 Tax=Microbacterium gorillae TaxID=1231063 RepID=UPI003D969DF4
MVADRIAISPSGLTAHAEQVEQLATDVTVALDAVRGINLGGGAFGVMCAWMVPPALTASTLVINHIQQAQDVLQRTSDELRSTADDFRAMEDGNIAALNALLKSVESLPAAAPAGSGSIFGGVLE